MKLCLRGATHLQKASSLRKAMKTIEQSTETMNPAHLHVTMRHSCHTWNRESMKLQDLKRHVTNLLCWVYMCKLLQDNLQTTVRRKRLFCLQLVFIEKPALKSLWIVMLLFRDLLTQECFLLIPFLLHFVFIFVFSEWTLICVIILVLFS